MLIGRHAIADISGCCPKLLRNEDRLNEAFIEALEEIGATILHYSSYKFPGEGGVTGLFLLAESHASYHSYPEYGYLAADFFTCGQCDPERALAILNRHLSSTSSAKYFLERRLIAPARSGAFAQLEAS